jgi:hypothetical protein
VEDVKVEKGVLRFGYMEKGISMRMYWLGNASTVLALKDLEYAAHVEIDSASTYSIWFYLIL